MEQIENAIITGARWNREPVLTHTIYFKGYGWGGSLGGYALTGEACYDWVSCLMEALEIDDISDGVLEEMVIRVKHTGISGKVVAIGHPVNDKWFEPEKIFEKYRGEK